MRRILAALLITLAASACGSYGGDSSPAGATAAPRASDAGKTPLPTGNPNVDNYGY
jgi:hypothetical protein